MLTVLRTSFIAKNELCRKRSLILWLFSPQDVAWNRPVQTLEALAWFVHCQIKWVHLWTTSQTVSRKSCFFKEVYQWYWGEEQCSSFMCSLTTHSIRGTPSLFAVKCNPRVMPRVKVPFIGNRAHYMRGIISQILQCTVRKIFLNLVPFLSYLNSQQDSTQPNCFHSWSTRENCSTREACNITV